MTDPCNESYFRGFQEKCAEYGVDPSTLYVAHVTRVISPEVRTAIVKVAMTKLAQVVPNQYVPETPNSAPGGKTMAQLNPQEREARKQQFSQASGFKAEPQQGFMSRLGDSLNNSAKQFGNSLIGNGSENLAGSALGTITGARAITPAIGAGKAILNGLDYAGRGMGDLFEGMAGGAPQSTRTEGLKKVPQPGTPAPVAPVAPVATPAPESAVAQNNNITPAPTAPQWPPVNLAPQTTASAATTAPPPVATPAPESAVAQNNNITPAPTAAQSLAGIRGAGAQAVQSNTGRMTMTEAKSRGLNFVQSNNTPEGQTTVMNGPGAQPAAKGGTINGRPVANYPLNRASGTNPIG